MERQGGRAAPAPAKQKSDQELRQDGQRAMTTQRVGCAAVEHVSRASCGLSCILSYE